MLYVVLGICCKFPLHSISISSPFSMHTSREGNASTTMSDGHDSWEGEFVDGEVRGGGLLFACFVHIFLFGLNNVDCEHESKKVM